MKKYLGIFLCLSFLLFPVSTVIAQEEDTLVIPTQTEQQEESEEETIEEEEVVQQEEIVRPEYSFLTILGAILIPSLFIIIGYIVLKLFKV